MATVTVSVLFTDLVGSTEFSHRVGPETADDTRREYFGLLRTAFSAHGGAEVKTGGDGLMVVFGAAADALAGAVAAQQAIELRNRRADTPLAMRVGVSAGDAALEEGDYFGMPVVEAARLCAAAVGGQILASDLVRALAGSRGGHDFRALGERPLKGVPDPVGVVEVGWTTQHGVGELPARLAVELERGPLFVGRVDELERLRDAWKRAVSGSRQALMLVGEPGIGKTRLAAQLAAEVHAAGCWVLYGRSDEVTGLPYQVFVEGLARVVADAPLDVLRLAVDRGGSDVGRIAPGLKERLSGLAEPPRLDAESERYRLFEAVAALLAALAASTPVLIVLDDLHWGDESSLLLFRHLLRKVDLGPVAVVATYRDTDLGRTHPLAAMLPDLLREPDVTRIALDGLTLDEVATLATDAGASGLASRIHDETRGNPLFVREVLLGLDGDPVERVPEGVREAVGRRLSRLSETANRVLGIAAVEGRDFTLPIVGMVTGLDDNALVDAIDEASDAGMVTEVPGTVDTYTFTHALVRSTLYEELSASRRVRLHRQVGEALETVAPADLVALSHHFLQAAPTGVSDKAIAYARGAAAQASDHLAFEEAARLYASACACLDDSGRHDPGLRCELLTGEGDALMRGGNPEGARAALREAATLARELRDGPRLATIAFALAGFGTSVVESATTEQLTLLDDALALVGDDDQTLRARLLARRATWKVYLLDREARVALAHDALTVARATGDDSAVGEALVAMLYALLGPNDAVAAIAAATELHELSRRVGDREKEFLALLLLASAYWLLGRYEEARSTEAEFLTLADELRHPFAVVYATASRQREAYVRGDLDEAERLLAQLWSMADRAGFDAETALAFGAAGALGLAHLREDHEQTIAVGEAFPDAGVFAPIRHPVLAWAYAMAGRLEEAHRELDLAAAANLDDLLDDQVFVGAAVARAGACTLLHDASHAGRLYDRLAHYASLDCTFETIAYQGSMEFWLGLLATTMDRPELAVGHLEVAVARHEKRAAPPWVALAQAHLALALEARQAPGDAERAAGLKERATATSERLNMRSRWISR